MLGSDFEHLTMIPRMPLAGGWRDLPNPSVDDSADIEGIPGEGRGILLRGRPGWDSAVE